LEQKKQELHLYGEVKWEKVTERYLSKYQELIRCFFEELQPGHVKVRVMFRQNANIPQNLTPAQIEMEYFMLYYQFIKHAFGLGYLPPAPIFTRLRLYFDQFPDTHEKAERFKGYLLGLQHSNLFQAARIQIGKEDITEVKSHDHVLLQCLDILLGAMAFRLNDKHKVKLAGKRYRGKRTIAKEALYKYILAEIYKIRPRFNVGMTTSDRGDVQNRWNDPYRHWCFVPKASVHNSSLTKIGQKRPND
jgi:hypothetical protein